MLKYIHLLFCYYTQEVATKVAMSPARLSNGTILHGNLFESITNF